MRVDEDLPESPKILLERPEALMRNEIGRMSLPGINPRSSLAKARSQARDVREDSTRDPSTKLSVASISDPSKAAKRQRKSVGRPSSRLGNDPRDGSRRNPHHHTKRSFKENQGDSENLAHSRRSINRSRSRSSNSKSKAASPLKKSFADERAFEPNQSSVPDLISKAMQS